jgi:putative FmdB family regulatory protein
MPIYYYKCEKCEFEFEDVKKIAERYEQECPNCKSTEIKIIPSSVNISVK